MPKYTSCSAALSPGDQVKGCFALSTSTTEPLAGLGFHTPEVVAHGQRRRLGFPRYAVLVTRQYERHIDLVTYLERAPEREEARRTVECAHALVDRAHSLGVVLLGAKYRNILVPPLGAVAGFMLGMFGRAAIG